MLTMLRLADQGGTVRVVDDQRGAPTMSARIARAVVRLMGTCDAASIDRLKSASGTYHATASGETTWHGFASAIFAQRARSRPGFVAPELLAITTAEYPTPAKRPAYSVLSNAKLERTFGVSLGAWQDGLSEALSVLARG